jgi:hypothetical protein
MTGVLKRWWTCPRSGTMLIIRDRHPIKPNPESMDGLRCRLGREKRNGTSGREIALLSRGRRRSPEPVRSLHRLPHRNRGALETTHWRQGSDSRQRCTTLRKRGPSRKPAETGRAGMRSSPHPKAGLTSVRLRRDGAAVACSCPSESPVACSPVERSSLALGSIPRVHSSSWIDPCEHIEQSSRWFCGRLLPG